MSISAFAEQCVHIFLLLLRALFMQVSCIEAIHQSLQNESMNHLQIRRLRCYTVWLLAKASIQMHLLSLLFLDLMNKTCHKISASSRQMRGFCCHLEYKPALGMCVDRSDLWMIEFSLISLKWEIQWEDGRDRPNCSWKLTCLSVSFYKVLKAAQLVLMEGQFCRSRAFWAASNDVSWRSGSLKLIVTRPEDAFSATLKTNRCCGTGYLFEH